MSKKQKRTLEQYVFDNYNVYVQRAIMFGKEFLLLENIVKKLNVRYPTTLTRQVHDYVMDVYSDYLKRGYDAPIAKEQSMQEAICYLYREHRSERTDKYKTNWRV